MAAYPTAADGPYRERPEQIFDHYVGRGITDLVAEEKHMGSHTITVACRSIQAAWARFGVEDGKALRQEPH